MHMLVAVRPFGPLCMFLQKKVTRCHKVEILFANNSVQNRRRVSRQKLKCSLFNSLNISEYDYGRRNDSFKDW